MAADRAANLPIFIEVSATPHERRPVQNYATCTGAAATDVASIGAATCLVSVGRIYSHLEVLILGIWSGNRNVFTNTPKADFIMYNCYFFYCELMSAQ